MEKSGNTTYENLAEIIGKEAAINLCEHYGGSTLYFRKTIELDTTKKHWKSFFGEDAHAKLFNHFGGKRCYIPVAPPDVLSARNNEIVKRLKNGGNREAIAKEFCLTPRSVSGIYQKHMESRRGDA